MKAGMSTSPFAAANRQEQQAQWLLWQTHSVEVVRPEVHSESPEELAQWAEPALAAGSMQRRRYDAVVQRMQSAKQKTGAYTAWNQESPKTMQPSSGSPKAEK